MSAPESPCILVCMMDQADLYCLGCHRTRDEIARWGSAGDEDKREILAAVKRRQAGRKPSTLIERPLSPIRGRSANLDATDVSCEHEPVETIKTIISKDAKHRVDIDVSPAGLYRYATFDDRYREDPDFQSPPEWTIDAFSGLFGSAEDAEADARAKCVWMRE